MARQQYRPSNPARNQHHHLFVAERSHVWLPPFAAIGAWADPQREPPVIDWPGFEARLAAQSPLERLIFETRVYGFLARVRLLVLRWHIADPQVLAALEQRAQDLDMPLATVWRQVLGHAWTLVFTGTAPPPRRRFWSKIQEVRPLAQYVARAVMAVAEDLLADEAPELMAEKRAEPEALDQMPPPELETLLAEEEVDRPSAQRDPTSQLARLTPALRAYALHVCDHPDLDDAARDAVLGKGRGYSKSMRQRVLKRLGG